MSEHIYLRCERDPKEWRPLARDPKEHLLHLLGAARESLDSIIETLKAAEEKDLDAACEKMFFELANIYFYLGLLGSNLRLRILMNILDSPDKQDKTDKTDKADEGGAEAGSEDHREFGYVRMRIPVEQDLFDKVKDLISEQARKDKQANTKETE